MSIRYTKSPVPSNPEELSSYLQAELSRISEVINKIADGHFDVSNVEPDKPRTGDIRYADGTNWNPGSTGEGVYVYLSTGAWSKL
jgi:hypothetical protein